MAFALWRSQARQHQNLDNGRAGGGGAMSN